MEIIWTQRSLPANGRLGEDDLGTVADEDILGLAL